MTAMRAAVLALAALLAAPAVAGPGEGAATADRKVLTLSGAKAVAAVVEAEAKKHAVGGAVAVVDDGGSLLYLARIDNTFPAAAVVAVEKARTAAQFRRATEVFENAIKGGRTSLVAVGVMTPLEGGVPIVGPDGQVLGAVGVSGAASAAQDNEFAKLAAASLK